jgi:hypothetical protein
LFLCACLAFCGASHAASVKAAAVKPLDQNAVKKYYNDGDFDPAINLLEDFQKTHAKYTREESLMVYKYLGVMYCADQSTREKGKSYFYKLLKIDPEAKILDMYVSIVVQDIFKSTLDELMGQDGFPAATREDRLSSASSPGGEKLPARKAGGSDKPSDAENPAQSLEARNGNSTYWWIGGLAVAAGVAGGYYLYASSNTSGPHDTNIPISP